MKEVIVAKSAGFCWGVRRAFDKVMKIAAESVDDKKVYTYGPLIHNPQAVSMLESKGICVLDQIPDKMESIVIVRTHGVSPDIRKKLRDSGAQIRDATCPDVGRIQGLVRKYKRQGYGIVIIGDKKHPEVQALLGFAGDAGMCIALEEDVKSLPKWDKVCIVSQSTQPQAKFWSLVEAVKKIFSEALVFDTICRSTEKRQNETKELSNAVDAMVVVGGHNSANTNRLTEICMENHTPTFQVETKEELDAKKLSKYKRIGVTAGASTPSWVIEEVVSFLRNLPNDN